MSRSIDQIQDILLPILGFVVHPSCLKLDGDPPFALQIHIIEHLSLHITVFNGAGRLKQSIG